MMWLRRAVDRPVMVTDTNRARVAELELEALVTVRADGTAKATAIGEQVARENSARTGP